MVGNILRKRRQKGREAGGQEREGESGEEGRGRDGEIGRGCQGKGESGRQREMEGE